ncbi:uncharacterized protein LOC126885682 [Diabrotica virgifera virgifera]|uniref:Uncharacterized protein LOC114331576 n=1 Tax=Diabrotica virgifera virgifera TaxID=50390 RepID=A0A6P7FL85_DIAVI|nr:uncharacterized protein LOC126885682 [Diabrotica virgifera virgifera]
MLCSDPFRDYTAPARQADSSFDLSRSVNKHRLRVKTECIGVCKNDDKVKVQPPILNNDSEMARNSSQSSSVPKSKTSSKIELELLRYLEDKRNNIHIINEYPTLKKIFIKFNTCLPSSGAVERLFSFAGIIDAPRRNGLTDENFEILVLCKANQKKYF